MTALLDSPSLVARYFGAWNARDPDAVAAAFAAGGTYTDPTVTGPPLTGTAIAEHARALLTAFPDLSFEVLGGQPAGGQPTGTVVAQWLMRAPTPARGTGSRRPAGR